MKKVFMTLAVVLMGVTAANAQFTIGGAFGLNGRAPEKVKVDGELSNVSDDQFKMVIAPKFGYMMNEGKMEVGALINLGYEHETSYVILKNKTKYSKDTRDYGLSLSVDPYFRYFFVQKGIFSLGMQTHLSLGGEFAVASKYYTYTEDENGVTRKQDDADKLNQTAKDVISNMHPSRFTWGLGIVPVMMFNLSDHCYMDVTFSGLGLGMWGNVDSSKVKVGDKTIKSTDSSFNGGFTLFNNQISAIKLGFAYKF